MRLPLKIDFPFDGTLALAGSGEYLPAMIPVDNYLLSRLREPARVVCLPTAAGTEGEARLNYWGNLGEAHFNKLGVASVASLPVFNRDDAKNPALVGKLREANFIYLSGGKPDYLVNCLTGTPLWDSILENLVNGGVVAGCSAGAMIFGERVPGRPFLTATMPAMRVLPGCFIVPHFDEIPFVMRFAVPHLVGKLKLIGVEANTILCCEKGGFFVAGAGGVTISEDGHSDRYVTGT